MLWRDAFLTALVVLMALSFLPSLRKSRQTPVPFDPPRPYRAYAKDFDLEIKAGDLDAVLAASRSPLSGAISASRPGPLYDLEAELAGRRADLAATQQQDRSPSDTIVTLLVAFGLLWTLVTKRPPSPRLRELANRIVAFEYRIGRYLTYNEGSVPFPFDEFPEPVEPSTWTSELDERAALGLEDDWRGARVYRSWDDGPGEDER